MQSIYALGDPRTGEIRYVGIAHDVYKRYAQHLNRPHANHAKNEWMSEIKQAGIVPTLTILEANIDDSAIHERERYWIENYLQLGAPLTNILMGKTPIEEWHLGRDWNSKTENCLIRQSGAPGCEPRTGNLDASGWYGKDV